MSERDAFEAVARLVVPGGRLLGSARLEGGVSAIVHALDIEEPAGETVRVVVRQQGTLKSPSADALATEFALVEALRSKGLPVARPRRLDLSGEVLARPYYVMDFVEGSTVLEGAALGAGLRQMAEFLARLHCVGPDGGGLPRLPELESPVAGIRRYLAEGPAREAVAPVLLELEPWQPINAAAVLHGDFWPGNILWRDGRIAAVLDWEDATVGDPLSDLACARVELLCEYGVAAMEAFTDHYREATDLDWTQLPVWEVYVSSSALATMADWGLAPEVESRRRAVTEDFLLRAARALAGQETRPQKGSEGAAGGRGS